MAAPKLTPEQRTQLLEWVAAEYSSDLIATWFAKREWPELTRPAITYYRRRFRAKIAALRDERHTAALDSGLALKAERVQRLKEHADALEAIKWVPGENGRLFNEKAWREVLDDIAKEMGHRRAGVDLTLEREIEAFLDRLKDNLSPEEYARILALAAGGATPSERSGAG
jgi:hypothetical protein